MTYLFRFSCALQRPIHAISVEDLLPPQLFLHRQVVIVGNSQGEEICEDGNYQLRTPQLIRELMEDLLETDDGTPGCTHQM